MGGGLQNSCLDTKSDARWHAPISFKDIPGLKVQEWFPHIVELVNNNGNNKNNNGKGMISSEMLYIFDSYCYKLTNTFLNKKGCPGKKKQ